MPDALLFLRLPTFCVLRLHLRGRILVVLAERRRTWAAPWAAVAAPWEAAVAVLGADLGSAWCFLVLGSLERAWYVLIVWYMVIEWMQVSLAHWPSQWEVVSKPDHSRVYIHTKYTPATSARMCAQFEQFSMLKLLNLCVSL